MMMTSTLVIEAPIRSLTILSLYCQWILYTSYASFRAPFLNIKNFWTQMAHMIMTSKIPTKAPIRIFQRCDLAIVIELYFD